MIVVIEPVARPHHVLAGALEVDRRADGGRRAQRRERALLAEIFQQHGAAQRVADHDNTVVRQLVGQLRQHAAEIRGAADMVMLPAIRPRGAAAAQVQAQHAVAALEQVARGIHHVGAVLAAGQTVNQDRQRTIRLRFRRPVEHADQDVTAVVRHAETHPLAGVRRQIRPRHAVEPDGDGLQVRAPPRKTGRNGGKSRESMDGGTASPYSQLPWHENAGFFPEFRLAGRHLCRERRDRFQHGRCHRAPRRPAGLGCLLLAFGVPGCHDVATAFLATARRPDRRPQRRPRTAAERAPAGRQLRRLHPGARPGAGRQRAADVRRHALHHCPAGAAFPRRAAAWPHHPRHGRRGGGAGAQRRGLACRPARSPAWRWPSSSCCA